MNVDARMRDKIKKHNKRVSFCGKSEKTYRDKIRGGGEKWRFECKKIGEAISGAILKITTYFFLNSRNWICLPVKLKNNGSLTAAPTENSHFPSKIDIFRPY